MRGVAFSVPHVISCLTACGPNSDGVGEGIEGTSAKSSCPGDFGRSSNTHLRQNPSGMSARDTYMVCLRWLH